MLESFVKTESLYAAIFDLSSPVNVPGMARSTLRAADSRARESGQPWASLYHFNDALERLAHQGALIAWTVVFDGVYKIVVEVLPPGHSTYADEQEVSGSVDDVSLLASADIDELLHCPSGRLAITCLGAVGERDLAPTVTVEPGIYRARLHRDAEQEYRHSFLEEGSDYPFSDGPDWRLWLQRQNLNSSRHLNV